MDFSINIRLFQNQVHRRGAEIAEKHFFLIQSRLGRDWIRNLIPSGLRSESLDGYGIGQEPCPERTQAFLFGGISPPNKKVLLCVLGGSAVKSLFWTSMIGDYPRVLPVSRQDFGRIYQKMEAGTRAASGGPGEEDQGQ